MTEFIVKMQIDKITLFGQDWGGLIGLRLVARMPERFSRVAIGNTKLPMGEISKTTTMFQVWASVVSQQADNWGEVV